MLSSRSARPPAGVRSGRALKVILWGLGIGAIVAAVITAMGSNANSTFSLVAGNVKPSGGGWNSSPSFSAAPQRNSGPAPAPWQPQPAPVPASVSVPTPAPAPAQEQYGHLVDNAFQSARIHPLSTISTEVNTAGYSNVRRFLNQGTMPPRDAVFVAEMINYFPYNYPQPTGADPVSLTLDLGQCPWKPEHHIVRVGVKARELDASTMPPRNFVFLVDVSGSMGSENRLPLVKKCLNMLVDTLTPKDFVSIVTYAGDTSVKLGPTSGVQKGRIKEVVNGLGAGGGTNGASGINLAYDQARASFIEGGANRVLICTDGDFNVGVTSEGELVRLIEKQRQGNIYLSVLGFGVGNYKDGTLKKLANHGNGQHAYIDTEAEGRKVFVEGGGTLVPVAKDVKLQVEFNPARVSAYRLIGFENRILKAEDFKDDTKDAADLGVGHTVTALYEIVPAGVAIDLPGVAPLKYQTPTNATGADEWLTVKMRYKHPTADKSLEVAKAMPGDAIKADPSPDFRFAMAVAEFGQILRDSPFRGNANSERVIRTAESSATPDPSGHRAEFIALARKALQLKTRD